MKKVFAILLASWIAACSTTSSPNFSAQEQSVTPEAIQTSATDAAPAPPPTPSITLTPSLAPAEAPAVGPTTLPATLIIPTLRPGSPFKPFLRALTWDGPWFQIIDKQIGWAIQQEASEVLRSFKPGERIFTPYEGYILRTTDGGRTWQNVTPPSGAYSPGGFFALDGEHAWASENIPCCMEISTSRTWRTTDGGRTWQPSQPFSIQDEVGNREFYWPLSMQFVDQYTGWLLAEVDMGMGDSPRNMLFRTTDGGDTWTHVNRGGCFVGLAFVSATTGWYGTECYTGGKIDAYFETYFTEDGWRVGRTTDGGYTFPLETFIPTPPELQPLQSTNPRMECFEIRVRAFTPAVIGIEWGCNIYDLDRAQYRYFSLSTDAGQSWKTWPSAGNEYFVNATHGWRLLAPGQLQQTTDSGLHWVPLKTVAWEYAAFDFIGEQEGWAIVLAGGERALVHTTVGGKTWEEIKPVIASR